MAEEDGKKGEFGVRRGRIVRVRPPFAARGKTDGLRVRSLHCLERAIRLLPPFTAFYRLSVGGSDFKKWRRPPAVAAYRYGGQAAAHLYENGGVASVFWERKDDARVGFVGFCVGFVGFSGRSGKGSPREAEGYEN
jgi:hypothetical protein